jgi:hypothetical protein
MQMADKIDGENGIVAEHSRVLEASKFYPRGDAPEDQGTGALTPPSLLDPGSLQRMLTIGVEPLDRCDRCG